jgi:hypothetical protein
MDASSKTETEGTRFVNRLAFMHRSAQLPPVQEDKTKNSGNQVNADISMIILSGIIQQWGTEYNIDKTTRNVAYNFIAVGSF